jgi:RNA polymerase sigma-70 factor (ECF subfamily)
MARSNPESGEPRSACSAEFPATRWSVVLRAGQATSPGVTEALGQLCRAYWYPIYSFVRRRGYETEEAKDLTQEFFARLLAKHYLDTVDPEKGRFRSFLLASVKHFLANEWHKSQRLKRGGGCQILSLEDQDPEQRYRLEPVENATPELIYERRWAETLVAQVLNRLRQEFIASGKGQVFDQLKAFLVEERGEVSFADAAGRLGLTEGATRSRVHRLRERFRELLLAEIANIVASPQDVEEEIRHLLSVLAD